VPFIARQPGTLPAGRESPALSSNLDLLPTLAAMAGAALPPVELDGRDLSQVLQAGAPSPHDEIVLFNNTKIAAVRTERWKYVVRTYYRTYDVNLARYGYPLLFDMASDPGENYGVAYLHPEVAEQMKGRIDRARAKYEPMAEAFPVHVAPASAKDHPD
jgi:arylsulfatase A